MKRLGYVARMGKKFRQRRFHREEEGKMSLDLEHRNSWCGCGFVCMVRARKSSDQFGYPV